MKELDILVPVDFSELSLKALDAANKMAAIFDGNVTAMHAYVPVTELEGPYTIGLGPNLNEEYEEIQKSLQEKLDSTSQTHIDHERLKKGIVTVGSPAAAIMETAKDFDMVCMSTHGRTGFTRLLLGSVAEKVLRQAHIPVMVVENESVIEPLERILVTTDLSENSVAAFPYARQLAETTGAKVDLVHVISTEHMSDEDTVETILSIRKERLKVIAKEFFHNLEDGQIITDIIVSNKAPHEAILQQSKKHLYNMVVMASIGHTGLDYLMMGSTTANVVRNVKAPVMTIKPDSIDNGE